MNELSRPRRSSMEDWEGGGGCCCCCDCAVGVVFSGVALSVLAPREEMD